MVLVVAPVQIIIGDQHGLMDLEYQPAKIAAVEGHWENKPGEGVPLILFGLPDMNAERRFLRCRFLIWAACFSPTAGTARSLA
jgi:cytochrome bd-type quinol oxidase subunit 1